jgi:hypothetical protein
VAGFRWDSVASSRYINSNGYASGPSDPFGSGTVDSEQMSLFATYNPASAAPTAPANSAPPSVAGTAEVAQTLTAGVGSWSGSPTSYAYQWKRCDAAGASCAAIAGATSKAYVVQSGDLGATLRVAVTASNSAGSATASSAPTAKVQAASSKLGKTTVGTSSDSFAADRKRVNRYTLNASGTLTSLSIYLAPTTVSGQQVLRGVVYADAGGTPGKLLGSSSELTFHSSDAAGWYDLPLPSALSLPAGSYWIGVITGGTSYVAGFRWDSVASSRYINSNGYASGPSDPFGSGTVDSEQMSLFAKYSP